MRAELRRLHDQLGTTMIYVTHDQTEAMTLADRLAIIDRGRIQQVGAPRDLYDGPDTLFVARFIGYPQMNVLDAVIEGGIVRAGALHFPIQTTGIPGHLRNGAPVKLGIRPEHLAIMNKEAAEADAGSIGKRIEATLRLVEHTGSQLWATVEVVDVPNAGLLVGHAPLNFSQKPGRSVTAIITDGVLHLFDADTGRSLK